MNTFFVNLMTLKDYEIWTLTWENLYLSGLNIRGKDQPVHPRSLISAFVIHSLETYCERIFIFLASF